MPSLHIFFKCLKILLHRRLSWTHTDRLKVLNNLIWEFGQKLPCKHIRIVLDLPKGNKLNDIFLSLPSL